MASHILYNMLAIISKIGLNTSMQAVAKLHSAFYEIAYLVNEQKHQKILWQQGGDLRQNPRWWGYNKSVEDKVQLSNEARRAHDERCENC